MKDNKLLFDAVLQKDEAEVKTLVESGSDVECRDDAGRTPLMHAVIDGADSIVQTLLRHGSQVDTSDKNGFTSLHFAAQEFRLEAARMLLDRGATPDAVDTYGNTPLWRAVFNSRGRGEFIQLLVEIGADPHLKNHSGVSPFDLAHTISNYDVKQFFR